MIDTEYIVETLKKVNNKYGGIKLGIAGSYANNTTREKSDLDIVVLIYILYIKQ